MTVADTILSIYLDVARLVFERRISLSRSSVLELSDGVLTSECSRDEIVLFSIESRGVYLLNHTAATVIRLTDGTRTLGRVAAKIAWDFDANIKTVVRDIKKVYRDLHREGVIAMTPDRSVIPVLKRETVIREEDDGALIFDQVDDELSAVNETGLLVLRKIDGKRSLADIINAVAAEFSEIDPEQIGSDVEAFVEGLIGRGLIET